MNKPNARAILMYRPRNRQVSERPRRQPNNNPPHWPVPNRPPTKQLPVPARPKMPSPPNCNITIMSLIPSSSSRTIASTKRRRDSRIMPSNDPTCPVPTQRSYPKCQMMRSRALPNIPARQTSCPKVSPKTRSKCPSQRMKCPWRKSPCIKPDQKTSCYDHPLLAVAGPPE